MVVKGIVRNSVARNGLVSFVLPCYKVELQFCNWGGSSQGMREYLTSKLFTKMATEYPQVQFEVVKKSGHPVLKGFYGSTHAPGHLSANSRAHVRSNLDANVKPICVKNLTPHGIRDKLALILSSSGTVLKKHAYAVESHNDSVRGVWSPFHCQQQQQHQQSQ